MRFQRELAHYMAEFVPGPGSAYVQLIKELGITQELAASRILA